jgi:3-oxoacyl-[acyl-carrier protein] reductase
MNFSLSQKVALVTGSSRGLGRGVAMTLGKAGAKVVLNYLNDRESAERTLTELRDQNVNTMLVRADASDPEQVSAMVEAVEEKFGALDILVPNATPDQPQKPIEEYDADFYRQMYEFFVLSPYHLARAVLPGMKERKWGRIINITSEVFHCSVPEFSAYVAAKGGQIGWSRSMASELAPFGITVNTVAPGWIPTERHENDPQDAKDAYLETVPLGRWGTPEDVGNAVAYFSSEEASFITGQTLCVNGGRTPW